MKMSQILVTVEMAKSWLSMNYKNQRLLKPMLVEYLVRALKNNRWNSDLPQPIMISDSGYLLDGQHRCHAIVVANKPAMCWVATEVPESAYPDIDSGISRQLYDRVSLTPSDLKLNKFMCALVTFMWFKNNNHRGRPNPEEAMNMFKKHSCALRWVASQKINKKGLCRIQVAVALAEMYEISPEKAQRLSDTVYHGKMERKNGIRLREFLLKLTDLKKHSFKGSFDRYIYQTCVYVCKAELKSENITRLGVALWDNNKNELKK